MVVVISRAGDSHTHIVMQRLAQRGTPAELLDLTDFPQRARLSMRRQALDRPLNGNSNSSLLHTIDWPGQRKIRFEDAGSIWWRRPQPCRLDSGLQDPGHAVFATGEVHEACAGLWLSLDTFWINHPLRDQEAGRKAYQLRVAAELGFEIPDTLITNSPEEAREFIGRRGPERTVYKSFSATAQHWRETRVLKQDEMALLDNVRYAPVIFQEYVPAEVDLRITVIGDRIFPAAIHSQEGAYRVDFRMEMLTARMEACTLPDDVDQKLRSFMQKLNLVYGAIDMRRTPDGRYVFLEINPAGQWMFVEERTGQPITEELCSLLTLHERRA